MNEAIEIAINVLIKPFEGYAKRLPNGDCCAYPDPGTGGDPWTIGYGAFLFVLLRLSRSIFYIFFLGTQ